MKARDLISRVENDPNLSAEQRKEMLTLAYYVRATEEPERMMGLEPVVALRTWWEFSKARAWVHRHIEIPPLDMVHMVERFKMFNKKLGLPDLQPRTFGPSELPIIEL